MIDSEGGISLSYEKENPIARQNFTKCHELGHFLLGHQGSVFTTEPIFEKVFSKFFTSLLVYKLTSFYKKSGRLSTVILTKYLFLKIFIILLNMAVDWYLHQELRIGQAIGNFLYSAGGGIFLGALVATLLVFLRQESFRSKYHLSAGVAMPVDVIFFLTPLIIYFLAEEIHVSGIIAVVAAGLIHNVESERSRLTNAFIFYNGIILYLANLFICSILRFSFTFL